ncbi:MAG: peptidoglycan DD-metalloendopeptidase family protein [Gemmatimonadota bacterium]|nr:MAG: peptidoglycan DD-metalloendopeptidase family protein [Gemmatimonadota bacterium]
MRSETRVRPAWGPVLGLLIAAGAVPWPSGVPGPLAVSAALAQDTIQSRIEESQGRLEQIRAERERLRREMGQLAGQVHNETEAIANLERQIGTSSSVVAELDLQLSSVNAQVDRMTADMIGTRDQLALRKAVMRERLRQIYKRGPLGTIQVLLGARSFTDLIHRYKYLRLVALQDRMILAQVEELESRLSEQRERQAVELAGITRLRREKVSEVDELESLERQRQRRLARIRSQESAAQNRLSQLARDEERLRQLLVQLETARREAERLAGEASTPTLRTADLGNLDWPVQGSVVYSFGPERNGRTTLARDGIGIGAPTGTPVHAIESGRVAFAGPWGLYGPSVILSHGGGYYSLYLYMQNLTVDEGDAVDAGQILGSVGGAGSPEGPHIEFQILQPGSSGEPRPVDPVRWLRDRS